MLTKIKKLLKYTLLFLLTMILLFLLQVIVDTSVWKILELLLIPLALAIGIWWLNKNEKENEQKLADIKEKSEKEIARNKQQEAILEEYFDRMTYFFCFG